MLTLSEVIVVKQYKRTNAKYEEECTHYVANTISHVTHMQTT